MQHQMERKTLNLICVYLPEEALETVKQAMFAAGAGHFPGYDQCCWQTLGQGQFRPLQGANPSIGNLNQVTIVNEYKLEMICRSEYIASCVDALKSAHPYEVPAYHIIPFYI
jgi:hypothetical protein